MTHKRRITSTCLFFPDTQMASLEKEQSFLRQYASKNVTNLPFNLFPPLCPFSLHIKKKSDYPMQLSALAPEIRGNWIIRPIVRITDTCKKNSIEGFSERGITEIPLYQNLPYLNSPTSPYFIIGYIQDFTDDQKKDLLETLAIQRENYNCPEIIPVKVWYHAKVELTLEYLPDSFYSCFQEIAKPVWEKGNR